MSRKKNTIDLNKKDLEKDIETYLKSVGYKFASEAADQITHMAATSIEQFYLDYSPYYYDRTLDLLKNSYKRYYYNDGKGHYYGGVILSPDNMDDYQNYFHYSRNSNDVWEFEEEAYSVTRAEDVFRWTWLEGYHGYQWSNQGIQGKRNITKSIQTRPPISMLIEKAYDAPFYNQLEKNSLEYAESKKYKYLRF